MCGILFIASPECIVDGAADAAVPADYSGLLTARGPDYQHAITVQHGSTRLLLGATLLQLRGRSPSTCPLQDSQGNLLAFNGEIFGGLHVPAGCNDGHALLDALSSCADEGVPQLLSTLEGPWALMYWRPGSSTLWYGRDVMGRRSLLLHLPSPDDPRLVMTSMSPLSGPGSFPPELATPPPAAQHSTAAQTAPAAAAAAAAAPSSLAALAGDPCSAAPAGSAGCGKGSGSAAAGEGGEEEAGSSGGYWQEVAPGVYSMKVPQAWEGAAAGAGSSAAADPGSAAGSRNGPDWQPCRHAWTRSELCSLVRQQNSSSSSGSGGQEAQPGAVIDGSQPAVAGITSGAAASSSGAAAMQGSGQAYSSLRDAMSAPAFDACMPQSSSSPGAAAAPAAAQHGSGSGAELSAEAALDSLAAGLLEGAAAGIDLQQALGPLSQLPLPRQYLQLAAAAALLRTLEAAVRVRCSCIDDHGSTGTPRAPAPAPAAAQLPPAPVLLLFSGGVDSVLLAALTHRALPPGVPIDLANVCFDGGRSPDRLAARAALEEMASACPARPWRLIEVDRSLADVDQQRHRLLTLLQPSATVMDLNIGAALWFATSGDGVLRLPAGSTREAAGGAAAVVPGAAGLAGSLSELAVADQGPQGQQQQQVLRCQDAVPGSRYRSAARVVLLGHGADEQCAGYGRHRTRFREAGWPGLAAELALDVGRLWQRNLGRDDRLVADHGREARHPFLDEGVMWLLGQGLPLNLVADLGLAPGVGDKAVVRTAARLLGLHEAAGRVKRAIQFGSRIGKLSNERDFGSGRAANRRSAGSVRLQELRAP